MPALTDLFAFSIAGERFLLEGDFARKLAEVWRQVAVPADGTGGIRLRIGQADLAAQPSPQRELPRLREVESGDFAIEGRGIHGTLSRDRCSATAVAPDRLGAETIVRALLAMRVLEAGGFVAHGVGVGRKEGALLFVGRSGAGKSTLGQLAARAGLGVLSDEYVVVRPGDGGYRVHATPWNWSTLQSAPLRGVGMLVHSTRHKIRPVSRSDLLKVALPNAVLTDTGPNGRRVVFQRVVALLNSVQCLALEFAPDAGVASVVEQALLDL